MKKHYNKLQHERLVHGWKQEELAAKLGVDVRTVRRWESGHSVRPLNISGLTQVFAKSAEELGLIEDNNPETLEVAGQLALQSTPASSSVSDRQRSDSSIDASIRSIGEQSNQDTATNFSLSQTHPARLNILPIQSSPLIGREPEVAAACTLLQSSEVHLLTLAGTGGIGKTCLGLQVATELMPYFVDGVYFIPLASCTDPDLVIPTIAYILGFSEARDWSQLERLYAFLRDKHLLLLLDNFEQVVSAAPRIAELIERCQKLKVLVTSRTLLHVRDEHVFSIKPLALPDLDQLADGKDLTQYSAVALFLERARIVKPDFKVTVANIRVVAEICVHLDGLPLAIELAAARIKLLSPHALLTRLEHRLQVLTSFIQDMPARQQTLRNTLAWSYDLLSAQEQQLFRQLSVFVGGCTLEEAEEVCFINSDVTDSRTFSVLDGVTSLIDKSLLHQVIQNEDEIRITMLETIREYGIECLVARGELATMQRAHAIFYLKLAEAAAIKLTSAVQGKWFEILQQEHKNMMAALNFLIDQKEWEFSLRLCNALWRFWLVRGHLSQGRQVLEQVLNSSEGVAADIQAKSLNVVGVLAGMQGDFGQSETFCRESLKLFREQGDLQGCATSLWMLGNAALMRCDYTQAHSLQEEALTLFQEIGDSWGITSTLERLASLAMDEGDFTQALFYGEKALDLSRQAGDSCGIARSLDRLGLVTYTQGDLARAESLQSECLVVSRQVGDKRTLAYSLSVLGYVACIRGDYTAGQEWLEESMKLFMELGDRRGMIWGHTGLGWIFFSQKDFAAARAQYEESLTLLRKLDYTYKSFIALCLEGLAGTVSAQGNSAWAARLWGAAEALREIDGGPSVPPILHSIYERLIAILRLQLQEAFTTLWAEGRMMTLEQVLANQGPAMVIT